MAIAQVFVDALWESGVQRDVLTLSPRPGGGIVAAPVNAALGSRTSLIRLCNARRIAVSSVLCYHFKVLK